MARWYLGLAAVASLALVQGCAGVIVAGAAGTATMLHDRRPVTTQVEDTKLEFELSSAFSESEGLNKQSRIRVFAVNGTVLLVGQVPSSYLMDEVKRISASQVDSAKLHNELEIREPISLTTRSSDSWLSTKVRSALLADENTEFARLKIITEDGKVFLMGVVTRSEANIATEIVRNVGGVSEVVRVFEFVPEETARQ
ncbi:BON domain-containing protein [Neiella sp. HB171785]|uniref:BON domain-containing protein n=1 Tax=Neiella litorisoli TaxID=2771431 RepID=A0A8J6QJ65_9GAMM|nr:BON domain-containing protein [Neiella litorisoli]